MIKASARRHGIADDDIEHAQRNWLAQFELIDDAGRHLVLFVGPAWSGALIEIGVNDAGDVVHAMNARRQFLPRTAR